MDLKIFLLFSIIIAINCQESIESFKSRVNYYKNIDKISNNRIGLQYKKEKGFSCVAKDYIDKSEIIMKIPKEYALTPFNIFPFKFEIYKALKEIFQVNEQPIENAESKISNFLLVYNILYERYANKTEVSEYIKQNKLKHYDNLTQINPDFIQNLPSYLLNHATLTKEHETLLRILSIPVDSDREIISIHNDVYWKLGNSKHIEIIHAWIKDINQFKWAYGIALSRSHIIRPEFYSRMENKTQTNLEIWEKKNNEINRIMGSKAGCPILISYLDICNHYQPKAIDINEKKSIYLEAEPGYLNYIATNKFYPGEEVAYLYNNNPNNIALFSQYGFIEPNNIFNIAKIIIKDDTKFDTDKFNLCREFGCFGSDIKNIEEIKKEKEFTLFTVGQEKSLYNYGKIKFLNNTMNYKNIYKSLLDESALNYENEINAWLFYRFHVYHGILDFNKPIKTTLQNIQKYKNSIESAELEAKSQAEINDYKQTKMIYDMELSFTKILHIHEQHATNSIIKNAYNDIKKLKSKYF